MFAWIDWILNALGLVLTGLALLSPLLFWLAKLLIEKIISHEFENEREALRYQIATLLGRSAKVHDREFETLETVWEKASLSMGSAASVLALFQTTSDVTWIEGEQLDHILAEQDLPLWQIAKLKTLTQSARTKKLYEFTMEKKRRKAWKDAVDFNDYLIIKGIFLKADIEEKARALSNLIWELLDEDRWAGEEGGEAFKNRRALADRIKKEGQVLRDEVRAMVAARLWDVDLKKGA